MRKIITSTLALFLVGGLMSQTVKTDNVAKTMSKVNDNEIRVNDEVRTVESESTFRGACFFSETFSNGFDGDNGIGAFTVSDSGGEDDPIWRVADAGSPCGEFSDPATQALLSTTAADGWVIFDTDCWNTPVADGVFDTQGFMVSPELDMSARSTVIVEWEQVFRYCCFGASPLTIGVSTDGGTTYTEFPAHGTFIPEANDLSENALTTAVDVSCAAAGQSSVLIRWAYNAPFDEGYSHYFWSIDDICMYEATAENDLVLRQVSNGDVFNEWEYRQMPICLAEELEVGIMYRNVGFADQTGVDINIEVLLDNVVVFDDALTDLTIPSSANSLVCPYVEDTIYHQTTWLPEMTGDYILRVTLDNGEDDNPDDNVIEWPISYTDDFASHADAATFDGEFVAREIDESGIFQNHGFGAVLQPYTNVGTATGVNVAFGDQTVEDIEVTVGLFKNNLNTGELVAFANYDIQAGDIPEQDGEPIWTTINFEDEYDMEEDSIYFFFVSREVESEETFSIYGTFDSDTDFSSRNIDLTGDQAYNWFGGSVTHGIGLNIIACSVLSVDEIEVEGLGLAQNQPNPFSGQSMINYTLDKSIPLSFEVKDVTGKTVMYENLGTLQPGAHTIELDAADFEAGIYTYSLISGNARTTKKMVITK